jgi:CBS domain-containing protein
MKIEEVMTSPVVTVSPATHYKEIIELLLAWNISGLPVIDFNGQLVGIITEADLLPKQGYPHHRPRALAVVADVLSGREYHWTSKADGLTAGELMTTSVLTCSPADDVDSVARRMLDRGVKRLPVVVDDQLVGIVSRKDILATFDRPDAEIAQEITGMFADPRGLPQDHHVRVQVRDGLVILHGDTRFRADARVIVSTVSRVRGVIDVVDRLHWREPGPKPEPRDTRR